MAWLNNGWVVGIGGGILSGVFVAWITHLFLQRGVNKEYGEKVASGNRDVIYAVRPGISEGHIPTSVVLEALIHATARRHGIAASDMYGAREIAEELIKEVMDTSFLSSVKKSEYCEQLVPLQGAAQVGAQDIPATAPKKSAASDELADYRAKTTRWVSTMLGVITAMMALFSTIYSAIDAKQAFFESKQGLLIILMATGVLFSMMIVYILSQRLGRMKEERLVKTIREAEKALSNVEVEINGKPMR